MLTSAHETETAPSGRRDATIRLMAETLPLAGYRDVQADLPGYRRPELIQGAVRNHRPSLFCGEPRPVVMDVLATEGTVHLDDLASRWQLFASAAELVDGEFHVVVPRWIAGCDGRALAKELATRVGVRIGFIWSV